MDKYVKYPPNGPLPLPGDSFQIEDGCDLWNDIFNAAILINPAFNIYRIFDVVRTSYPDFLLDPSTFFLVSYSLGCPRFPVRLYVRRWHGPSIDLIQWFIPQRANPPSLL